ncbi:MAG: 50S ribosomal protein L6 [Dissulfurispiraceae bacterium]
MSRIGKKPIVVPAGVRIDVKDTTVSVKGQKGELTFIVPGGINILVGDGRIVIGRESESKVHRALHGLVRSVVSNMVTGVSEGYKRILEMKGVGYRAQVKENKLVFTLGYSYPKEYALPNGVTAVVDEKQTTITLAAFDKQLLGQVAANIKELRPPDAYKGKGIRYSGERLKLKAGKTGKK